MVDPFKRPLSDEILVWAIIGALVVAIVCGGLAVDRRPLLRGTIAPDVTVQR